LGCGQLSVGGEVTRYRGYLNGGKWLFAQSITQKRCISFFAFDLTTGGTTVATVLAEAVHHLPTGNVVNPDDVVAAYGADSLRLYEMFMGPLRDTKVGPRPHRN
jgi:hypothetical protein